MKKNFQIFLLALTCLVAFSCKNKTAEDATVGAAGEVAEATGMSYNVSPATSKVMWTGSKPTGKHNGTINVASGEVSVKDGKVTGGSFVIDMTSITCLDLEGDQKAGLEGHLKGMAEGKEDHFFNVVKYPTSTFEITNVKGLEGDAAANSLVYGNLTMRGISKEVGFKANIATTDAGVMVTAPAFSINRTDWGVNYGSKSIFDDLKDNFVNDDIELAINLNAGK